MLRFLQALCKRAFSDTLCATLPDLSSASLPFHRQTVASDIDNKLTTQLASLVWDHQALMTTSRGPGHGEELSPSQNCGGVEQICTPTPWSETSGIVLDQAHSGQGVFPHLLSGAAWTCCDQKTISIEPQNQRCALKLLSQHLLADIAHRS